MKPNLTQDDLLSARILKCYEDPDDQTPWLLTLVLCASLTMFLWAYLAWPAVLPADFTDSGVQCIDDCLEPAMQDEADTTISTERN